MKFTKLSTALTTGTLFLASALPVFAQTPSGTNLDPCDKLTDPWNKLCQISDKNTGQVIGNVVLILFIAAALIALFFLIWGGIKWILSGGDKTKVEAARSTIIAALIGLVVTFLSFFLLQLVLSIFGISLTDFTIPTLLGGAPTPTL